MMSVYIDKAFIPYGRMIMCHMIADSSEELHAMAEAIGMKPKWFQGKASFPHYDVCKMRRKKAIKLGAIEMERCEFVYRMREIKVLIRQNDGEPVWP